MKDKTANKIFDPHAFRQKVELRLEEIDNPLFSAAFALRVGLASLLGLTDQAGDKEFLWFWVKENREKYLLTVCRSLQIGWAIPADRSREYAIVDISPGGFPRPPYAQIAADAKRAVSDITLTDDGSNCVRITAAAYAAAYAAALYEDSIVFAADAATAYSESVNTAAYDTDTVETLFDFVLQELDHISRCPDVATYLSSPLILPFPELQDRLLSQLRQLPTFEYWADWFRDRYDGVPLDQDILAKCILLPETIQAENPRTINQYIISICDSVQIPIARKYLAQGDYESAWDKLQEIPKEDNETWEQVRSEFGFAFDFALDLEGNNERLAKWRGQIEWRRKVFAVLASDEPFEGSGVQDELAQSDAGPNYRRTIIAEESSKRTTTRKANPSSMIRSGKTSYKHKNTAKTKEKLPPERQGEQLERDTLRLLREIFEFDDESVQLNKLRQQQRGAQLGFDIKIAYCLAANNRNVRCCVECKSQEKGLSFADILAKLLEAEANQPDIEHWILIAPRARLLGNVPDDLVERWNAEQKWPFQVQFWTSDTDIGSLFGLDPDVYERWIDHPPDVEHPKYWTLEKREEVKHRWLGRIRPPLRLPQVWADYVTDLDGSGLFIENDDRDNLRELWRDNRYISPQVMDDGGSTIPGGLEKVVRNWLLEGPRVSIILGEFGDGKSAFTYMLSRELLRDFKADPIDGWIPLRFPLRYFSRPHVSAPEFLRNRLEKLGSDVNEWDREVVGKRNVLVILDGMDEMTKSLTHDAVRLIVDLLVDCCNRELELVGKILITCRRTFFDELAQRQYVEDKLGEPQIVRMEAFSRDRVYGKLEQLATPEQRARLIKLGHMHDPIGLARKPLFFKMVSQTLSEAAADFSSETGIYRGYVIRCLRRKVEFLEPGNQRLTSDELVTGMLAVMERIAMEMHLANREYVCLGGLANGDKVGSGEERMFAELLWQGMTEEPSQDGDAVHRVGVRSLLSKASGKVDDQDIELLPVAFCHRSVQEYFVARGIEKAIRDGRESAERVLSRVDINHEVLRFTAELMRASEIDYSIVLRDLAYLSKKDERQTLSNDEQSRRRRLGKTAISLIFKWSGDVAGTDWSRMLLDGAQLAGADLTGKDFRSASLRHANLNNAILNGADLRDADLTGVRLEEAGEISSLSVPSSTDAFFAAYRDGSVRRWPLGDGSDNHPAVVLRLSKTIQVNRNIPLEVVALPGSGLCVWDKDEVHFVDAGEPEYLEVSAFSINRQYLEVALGEKAAVHLSSWGATGRKIRTFNFSSSGQPLLSQLTIDSCVKCVALGNIAVLAMSADGDAKLHATGNRQKEGNGIKTLFTMHAPTCIAASQFTGSKLSFRVACGSKEGVIGAWQITLNESGACDDSEEIFCERIHDGAVRALGFLDQASLLTGGDDGKIHLHDLSDGKTMCKTFELKLRCQGAMVAGLKGELEREILLEAGALNEKV